MNHPVGIQSKKALSIEQLFFSKLNTNCGVNWNFYKKLQTVESRQFVQGESISNSYSIEQSTLVFKQLFFN